MNHWHLDAIAEARREDIGRELRSIRREQMPTARPPSGGRIARSMYEFADWMMVTGKQLRRSYEDPSRCDVVRTRGYAHQRVREKICNHP